MRTLFLRSRFPIALTLIASLAIAGCGGGSGKSKSSKSSSSVSSSVISASASSLISSSSQSSLTSSSSSSVVAKDASPDAPVFTPITNASINEFHTSNTVVLQGFEIPVAIRVVGGTYSVDGGEFTGAAGEVSPGQSVVVKLQAPANYSSADQERIAELTLRLGEGKDVVSSQFTVTTKADTTPPQAKMMFPPKYSYSYGDTTLVRLTFEDDLSGIGRVTYKVNDGEPVEIELTEENFEYKEDGGHWQLIHLFPVDAESVGKNKYTVKVEDGAGNPIAQEGEIDFYVTYQPAERPPVPSERRTTSSFLYDEDTGVITATRDRPVAARMESIVQYNLDSGVYRKIPVADKFKYLSKTGQTKGFFKLKGKNWEYALVSLEGTALFNLGEDDEVVDGELIGSAKWRSSFYMEVTEGGYIYALDESINNIYKLNDNFEAESVFMDISAHKFFRNGEDVTKITVDPVNNRLILGGLNTHYINYRNSEDYKKFDDGNGSPTIRVVANHKRGLYAGVTHSASINDNYRPYVKLTLFDMETTKRAEFSKPEYSGGYIDDWGLEMISHSPDTYLITSGAALVAIDWETGHRTLIHRYE